MFSLSCTFSRPFFSVNWDISVIASSSSFQNNFNAVNFPWKLKKMPFSARRNNFKCDKRFPATKCLTANFQAANMELWRIYCDYMRKKRNDEHISREETLHTVHHDNVLWCLRCSWTRAFSALHICILQPNSYRPYWMIRLSPSRARARATVSLDGFWFSLHFYFIVIFTLNLMLFSSSFGEIVHRIRNNTAANVSIVRWIYLPFIVHSQYCSSIINIYAQSTESAFMPCENPFVDHNSVKLQLCCDFFFRYFCCCDVISRKLFRWATEQQQQQQRNYLWSKYADLDLGFFTLHLTI